MTARLQVAACVLLALAGPTFSQQTDTPASPPAVRVCVPEAIPASPTSPMEPVNVFPEFGGIPFYGWLNGGYIYNASNPTSRFNGPYNAVDTDEIPFNQAYAVGCAARFWQCRCYSLKKRRSTFSVIRAVGGSHGRAVG